MDQHEELGDASSILGPKVMETFIQRFPDVSHDIFKQLGNPTLTNCKKVGRSWKKFLDGNKLITIRMLQKYQPYFIEFENDWKKAVVRMPLLTIKQFAIFVKEFYESLDPIGRQYQHSPLHIVAKSGNLSLFQFVYEKVGSENSNPAAKNGSTPLCFAATPDQNSSDRLNLT